MGLSRGQPLDWTARHLWRRAMAVSCGRAYLRSCLATRQKAIDLVRRWSPLYGRNPLAHDSSGFPAMGKHPGAFYDSTSLPPIARGGFGRAAGRCSICRCIPKSSSIILVLNCIDGHNCLPHFLICSLHSLPHSSIISVKSEGADAFLGRNPGVAQFLPRGGMDLTTVRGNIPEKEPVRLSWRSPHEAVADFSGQSEPFLLWMHFHPGWSAGNRAVLTSSPVGLVEVTDVRSPELPLVLRWEGTVWQRRGERLSLLALLACIAGILYFIWQRRKRYQAQMSTRSPTEKEHEEPLHIARGLGGQWALAGLLLVLVATRYSMSWFNTFPYLYHSPPGRLSFAAKGQPTTVGDAKTDLVTLLGWKLISGTKPRPGDIVIVRLYWQPERQISEELYSNVHLYTPALQRFVGRREPWSIPGPRQSVEPRDILRRNSAP